MRVLIYHNGKWGDSRWDASTDEKLDASARKIMGELIRSGWIPEPEDPMKHIEYSSIDMEVAQLTDEQVDDLPTESMRNTARKHKDRLARRIADHEDDARRYNEYVKFSQGGDVYAPEWVRQADSRDGKYKAGDTMPAKKLSAWTVLQGYEDQYVSFELDNVIDPDGD